MERTDAKVKFQDADRLFQTQQFAAALEILQELNRDFPGERHVLYPMARSLAGLKRYDEAREIARRLATEFQYLPAQDLIDRIDRLQAANDADAEAPVLPSGMEDLVLSPSSFGAKKTPPALRQQSHGSGSWQPYAVWIGLLVGSFAAMIAVGVTLGPSFYDWLERVQALAEQEGAELSDFSPVPWSAISGMAVANTLFAYFLSCFPAFWSIKIVDALRYDDFGENMKDVAVTTLIGYLLTFVLFIGWIIFLVILKKRYELSLGKLFAVVLLFLVFDVLTTIPASILYNVIVGGFAA